MGPVLIAYDGSPPAEHALREAASLVSARKALVVTVWEEGTALGMAQVPMPAMDLALAPIDIRTATAIDEATQRRAKSVAHSGAELARQLGLEAEGLAVADDEGVKVADILIEVAERRGARAIAVGTHGHGRLAGALLGSTTRDLVQRCTLPVVVVRQPEDSD